ncbi:capsular polysaccharide biosynthesis protein [bacterium]|nr:capsular polysaccharide biosynthesis protein [bacterium]
MAQDFDPKAAGTLPRRLFPYSAGFLTQPRLRRILTLAGHELRLGLPGPEDGVVVWGRSPYAWRGEKIAARRGVPLVRVEDTVLRSLRPGRMGDAPLGLVIDPFGVHFDSSGPSLTEQILARSALDDSNLLARSRDAIARIQALDLSKYNMHDPDLAPPPPGYVLIVDQLRGDASIRHAGANAARFAEMLALARTEHPNARLVIKTHPETQSGLRPGHYSTRDEVPGNITLCDRPVSPWRLMEGAIAVYTVSSQLGFEAILAGHRPIVMGQPFYAGWGLSDDRFPLDRRRRSLTRAQLFAGAAILAPTWYDPCRDRLCEIEEVIDQLEAETRAYRADRRGHVAGGMRLWKRRRLQQFFGRHKPLIFRDDPAEAAALATKTGRGLIVWAGKAPEALPCLRVEDGFLRSRGLGAALVPPLSLVTDDLGIYYDPGRESRLEHLIRAPLPPGGALRAEALLRRLIATRLTKYNLAGPLPDLPAGHRILVPGQVEDDASIRLGSLEVSTNLGLLQRVRAAHPTAVIVYKPHPDVEAGLRRGALDADELAGLADVVASHSDPVALIEACDAVWTMTSLLGFEALLRTKPVTCLGTPFYAGWGLTRDLGPVPARRRQAHDGHPLPRPTLEALIHAALIAYPRYFDPISLRPCPPEVAVERLASGALPRPGLPLRLLAKLQGAFASQAHLWR